MKDKKVNESLSKEQYLALLKLPRKTLVRLNDFLNNAYNGNGILRDIPTQSDIAFIQTLSEDETKHLKNLALLKRDIAIGLHAFNEKVDEWKR